MFSARLPEVQNEASAMEVAQEFDQVELGKSAETRSQTSTWPRLCVHVVLDAFMQWRSAHARAFVLP